MRRSRAQRSQGEVRVTTAYNNSNIIRCLHCLYIIVYTLLVYE